MPVWAVFTVLSIAVGNFLLSYIDFGDDGDETDCVDFVVEDDNDEFIDTGICLRGVGNGNVNDEDDDGDFKLYDLL